MHDDDLNENHVFDVIRDRLSKLTVAKPPPVEAIVARGRARRRRSGLAGMGLAAVGLAIALPVIITSINPAAPAVATHPRLGGGPVHVNLAAYSVDSNANGTVTVALAAKQSFNPSELRQVLAQAGIAAVVNVGAFAKRRTSPPVSRRWCQVPGGTGRQNRRNPWLAIRQRRPNSPPWSSNRRPCRNEPSSALVTSPTMWP